MEQKLRIKDFKHWPFPVVLGVDNRRLSDLDDKIRQKQSKCNIKWTKQPKCKLYDTVSDMEEALF